MQLSSVRSSASLFLLGCIFRGAREQHQQAAWRLFVTTLCWVSLFHGGFVFPGGPWQMRLSGFRLESHEPGELSFGCWLYTLLICLFIAWFWMRLHWLPKTQRCVLVLLVNLRTWLSICLIFSKRRNAYTIIYFRKLCLLDVPPITYHWTVPLILDHSYLVGKFTTSKIADTKVSGLWKRF
jgi:hypothetical protein